jgi:hypothetical protein
LARDTDRPGAFFLICLVAIFETCFFSCLLRALTVAAAATEVPATAKTRAVTATSMAAVGRSRDGQTQPELRRFAVAAVYQ